MANTPVLPIKGLSVREDTSGCPAIHQKIGKNKYVCLANFFFPRGWFCKVSTQSTLEIQRLHTARETLWMAFQCKYTT